MMQKTIQSRTIFCHDNLPIMRGMDSNSIDLIYLDPSINLDNPDVKEGSDFKNLWSPTGIEHEWQEEINKSHPKLSEYLNATEKFGSSSIKKYLIFMAIRLIEMHRILKKTGTIYLHCDPTSSHYLKLILDAIFGVENYRNEIAWCYRGPNFSRMGFPRKHDIIFRYSKSKEWTFNDHDIRIPFNSNGSVTVTKGKVPEDYWIDIPQLSPKERMGYATQKPVALLERIINASSNKGDLLLDPFCGGATACVVAEKLGRNWIGIDISAFAYEVLNKRLERDNLQKSKIIFREDVPERTDESHKRKNAKPHKEILFEKQNGKCNGCEKNFTVKKMQIDHIESIMRGGDDGEENLQLLCANCNRLKGNGSMDDLHNALVKIKNHVDMPNSGELMNPTIEALKKLGGEGHIKDVYDTLLEDKKIKNSIVASGLPAKEFSRRLAWARTHLKNRGLAKNVSRGVWVLTEKGKEAKLGNDGRYPYKRTQT